MCLVLAGLVGALPPPAPAADAEAVAPEGLWDALFAETPPLVVDVRQAERFAKLRIPRSRNLREPDAIASLEREAGQPIILVGDTEEQARRLAAQLKAFGADAQVVRGGLRKWPLGLEISAEELRRRLDSEKPPQLVDVRTTAEYEACRIEGTLHRPLDEVEAWGPTLSRDAEIVLVCRTGRRSGLAQEWLARHGFRHVHNLLGGTTAWPYGWIGEGCPQ